jgi:Clp amino terminal domain, pathogenicity island component
VFERFTERARNVVVLAQEDARTLMHDYIGTEHILLGLLREEEGLAAAVLESVDLTVTKVRAQVVRIVGSGDVPSPAQIPTIPRAENVLVLAQQESQAMGHDFVGTEHLLLALVRQGEGVGVRVLLDYDVDLADLRDEMIVRAGGTAAPRDDESTSSGPGPAIDPGWLDGLPVLLKPLGEEIRADLGRAPDTGDLLLALICVPHTPASDAFGAIGLDVDQLQGEIERARSRAETDRRGLAKRLTEVIEAKELAMHQQRFNDAAGLRDEELELRAAVKSTQRARLATTAGLRQRLGLGRAAEDSARL